jgi:hypothetical protein
MIITKDDAMSWWCPMSRSVEVSEHASNRIAPYPDKTDWALCSDAEMADDLHNQAFPASCRCIADVCAMWRWWDKHDAEKDPFNNERRGYCGLGSVPKFED